MFAGYYLNEIFQCDLIFILILMLCKNIKFLFLKHENIAAGLGL